MPEDSITSSAGSAPVAGANTGNGYGAYSNGASTDTGFNSNQDDAFGFASQEDDARQAQGANGSDDLWDPLESTCRHASLSIL